MDDDPIPLGQVYAAMEEHIRQAIPGLQYVGTMPSGIEVVPPPAVVLELAGFDSTEDDPGTGQTAVDARFEARVLVPGEEENCLHIAAFVAAQLAVLLRMQCWGLAIGFAQFVRAERDWSRPELDSYAVWVVEWTQVIYLGEEEWPWSREPGPLAVAFDPDSGPGNEHLYQSPEDLA